MTIDMAEHVRVVGRMKRRFLLWFASIAGVFLIVLGVVAHQIEAVADESCRSTNRIIDVIVDYNNDVLALPVPRDEYQRETARLRQENNALLEQARCKIEP